MRPVRVSDDALVDIATQIPNPERATAFVRLDLLAAIDLLANADDWHTETVAEGPGRRLTRDGLTVAGLHLLVAADPLDRSPDALLIYRIDIWPDGWPDDSLGDP